MPLATARRGRAGDPRRRRACATARSCLPALRRGAASDEPRGLARAGPFPLGADVGRRGHQLLAVLRARRARRAVPVRRRRPRGAHRGQRAHRLQLALLPARRRARPALRLPRPRALRPGAGAPLQPGQAADRPLRQGDRGPGRLGRGQRAALRARRRPTTPTSSSTTRTTPPRSPSASSSTTRFDWEGDTPAAHRPGTTPSSTRPTSRASRSATPGVREDLRGTYAGLASERGDRATSRTSA